MQVQWLPSIDCVLQDLAHQGDGANDQKATFHGALEH